MQFEKSGAHTFVVSLTPEEWKPVTSTIYRRHREKIMNLITAEQCWLPGSVGQRVYEYISSVWIREGVPYRLRSDPSDALWSSKCKKLRMQTIAHWEESQALLDARVGRRRK